jgi:tryptophan synthase alpha subunit
MYAEHCEAVVVASAMFDHMESLPESQQVRAAHEFIKTLVSAGE